MRPSIRQWKISAQAKGRALRLRKYAASIVSFETDADKKVGYSLLEMHNLWASYWRAFYYSAVMLGAEDKSRGKISPVLYATERDAIVAAVSCVDSRRASYLAGKPRITHRDEPAWFDENQCEKIFLGIGFNNQVNLSRLLAFDASFAKNLPTMRNFYAHKARSTYEKLAGVRSNLGVARSLKPYEIVLAPDSRTGDRILVTWLDNMIAALELYG